ECVSGRSRGKVLWSLPLFLQIRVICDFAGRCRPPMLTAESTDKLPFSRSPPWATSPQKIKTRSRRKSLLFRRKPRVIKRSNNRLMTTRPRRQSSRLRSRVTVHTRRSLSPEGSDEHPHRYLCVPGQGDEFVVTRDFSKASVLPILFRLFDSLCRTRYEVPPHVARPVGWIASDEGDAGCFLGV